MSLYAAATRQATRTSQLLHPTRTASAAPGWLVNASARRGYASASEGGAQSPRAPGTSTGSSSSTGPQSNIPPNNSKSGADTRDWKRPIYLVIAGLAVVETAFYFNVFTASKGKNGSVKEGASESK
ncbi:hypothetical protein GYMLUDRAFT_33818 [Collybiopsis luxurians FD-317 M1]|nr:hypothetical protein GYMLUDRAFT_33818 [Collybiopsis luxurians FD-317 M1]